MYTIFKYKGQKSQTPVKRDLNFPHSRSALGMPMIDSITGEFVASRELNANGGGGSSTPGGGVATPGGGATPTISPRLALPTAAAPADEFSLTPPSLHPVRLFNSQSSPSKLSSGAHVTSPPHRKPQQHPSHHPSSKNFAAVSSVLRPKSSAGNVFIQLDASDDEERLLKNLGWDPGLKPEPISDEEKDDFYTKYPRYCTSGSDGSDSDSRIPVHAKGPGIGRNRFVRDARSVALFDRTSSQHAPTLSCSISSADALGNSSRSFSEEDEPASYSEDGSDATVPVLGGSRFLSSDSLNGSRAKVPFAREARLHPRNTDRLKGLHGPGFLVPSNSHQSPQGGSKPLRPFSSYDAPSGSASDMLNIMHGNSSFHDDTSDRFGNDEGDCRMLNHFHQMYS